jgi:hypothetical protein
MPSPVTSSCDPLGPAENLGFEDTPSARQLADLADETRRKPAENLDPSGITDRERVAGTEYEEIDL